MPNRTAKTAHQIRNRKVIETVSGQISELYASPLADKLKEQKDGISYGNTTILLARKSGFCYGVRRAIDLAYATCKVFPDKRKFLIGEMIHNPEVNENLSKMGIQTLPWKQIDTNYDTLTSEDVVIIPAFGVPLEFMAKLEEKDVTVVDTTCGDVMKVWRRVKSNAKRHFTSIIHGKIDHEETQATISRALGEDGKGHYIVVLNEVEATLLANYIAKGNNKEKFLNTFAGASSPGFDPDIHLKHFGMANQTTMFRKDTEAIQEILLRAVLKRDGHNENFHIYDTICNATQYRQDALHTLVGKKIDVLFVVGGFNSANTTHLVETGLRHVPTFFIRNSESIESFEKIAHFDIEKQELQQSSFTQLLDKNSPIRVGITAGASCPNNLLEDTIAKILHLRDEYLTS